MPPPAFSIGRLAVDLLLQDQGFKKGLTDAQKQLQTAGGQMKGFADAVQSKVVTALKLGTAAVTGFTTAAAVVGAGFEQQMALVGAVTDATGTQMQALTDQARMLGATTGFTATQAAEGLFALGQAGATVEESIQASNAAMLLAGTTQSSMVDSTSMLISTMRQFGLASTESTRIADVMSLGMRKSLLDFSSLSEAMKFAGTAGASFGMTLEETVAAVAKFRDLGLEGSLAGNAFKMAMIHAGQATKEKEEVLAKYGLTLRDINPETHKFADLLDVVAEHGITATDSIELFGARSGANVAQLAKQVATGQVDIRALAAELEQAAGTTVEMYSRVGDTVLRSVKRAMAALSDLFIEVFDTFRGPLRNLLMALPGVFNVMRDELAGVSVVIRQRIGDIMATLQVAIGDNRQAWADLFVDVTLMVVEFTAALVSIVAALAPLVPLLDELAILMASVWVASKVQAVVAAVMGFAAALVAGTAATGGLQTALVALYTSVTIASGGTLALVAAVGALVATLGTLVLTTRKARVETDLLREANAKLTEQSAFRDAEELDAIRGSLAAQKDRARVLLESGEKLGKARQQELIDLLKLSAEEVQAKVRAGELVKVGAEGFRSIAALIEESGRNAPALVGTIADLAAKARDAEQDVADLRDRMSIGLERGLFQVDSAEMAALRAALAKREDDLKRFSNASQALESARLRIIRGAQEDAAGDEIDALRAANLEKEALSEEDAKNRVEALREAAAELAAIAAEEQDLTSLVGLEGGETRLEQLRQEERDRLAEVEKAGAEYRQLVADDAVAVATIDSELASIRMSIATRFAVDRAEVEAELANAAGAARDADAKAWLEHQDELAEAQAKALADQQAAFQSWADGIISRFGVLGDIVRLFWDGMSEQGQEALARVLQVADATVSAVSSVFSAMTGGAALPTPAEAVGAALEGKEAAADAAAEAERARLEEAAEKRRAPMEEAGASEAAIDAMLESQGLSASAIDAKAAAAAKRAAEEFDVEQAGADFADQVVNGAIEFADTLAVSVDDILIQLSSRLDDLVRSVGEGVVAIIGQVPKIATQLFADLPAITTELLGAAADMVVALVDAVPKVVAAFGQQLPEILDALLVGAVKVMVTIAAQLPAMAAQIAAELLVLLLDPQFWVDIAKAFVNAFVTAMVEATEQFVDLFKQVLALVLPKSVRQLLGMKTEGKEEKNVFERVAHGVSQFFEKQFGGIHLQAGLPLVPREMRARLHPGEAVLTREQNLSRLGLAAGQGAELAVATAGARPAGPSRIEVVVMAEGRVLEGAMLQAEARGHTGGRARQLRRAAGVTVGFQRGKFAGWSRNWGL